MGWREAMGIGALRDAQQPRAGTQSERIAPPDAPQPREHTWSGKVFDQIEWRRFEAVCEALFTQSGMRAETQSHGADGGVDIWLWSAHSDKPVIVQCKHWKKRVVGVKELREFYGVLRSHDLKYGTFATSSNFSSDALKRCAGFRPRQPHQRPGPQRHAAVDCKPHDEATAHTASHRNEGKYWKPTCAKCGGKMVLRKGKDSEVFWGCRNYGKTKCRNTMRHLKIQ